MVLSDNDKTFLHFCPMICHRNYNTCTPMQEIWPKLLLKHEYCLDVFHAPLTMALDLTADQRLHLRLIVAKGEFLAFIQDYPQDGHFLSVSSQDAPLRRIDRKTLKTEQLGDKVDEHYVWDKSKGRWTRKDGAMIVLENEIYDVILSYFRQLKQRTWNDLWPRIHREVEGVLQTDLREARRLWYKYDLEALDKSDNALWGGPSLLQGSCCR